MAQTIGIGLSDLAHGLMRLPLSNMLAWSDIRARYARSFIGPFWMSLSMLGVTLAISFLTTGLFGGTLIDTIPFVMIGITVYGYLQQSMNDTATCLIGARGHLLGSPLPYSTFIFSALQRNLLMVAHQFPAILLVMFAIGIVPKVEWLWSIAGMALVIGTAVGLALFLSVITARFRDIAPIVALVSGIGALMSPVYWKPETLVKNEFIATLNPVTYLLAVVRDPMIGKTVSQESWIWASVTCASCITLGLVTFALNRKRLAFWI